MSAMRSVVGCVVVLAVCASAEAQLGLSPPAGRRTRGPQVAAAPPIEWVEGFEKARAEAKRTGRPIFVFFHDSLKGARLLEVGTVHTPEVQKRAQRFVCVQVDPEKEMELVKTLKIKMSQGVMFVDAELKVLGRLEGNPTPEAIATGMDGVLKEFGPVPSDGDLQVLDKMLSRARSYRKLGRVADALKMLKRMTKTGAKCESVLQAKSFADEIEADGTKALAAAEALAKGGKSAEAVASLRKLASAYYGTETGDKAKALAAKLRSRPGSPAASAALAKKVKSLWGYVQSAKNRGRVDLETEHLESIVEIASGADKDKAAARLAQIEGDPELKAKRDLQVQERAAKALLARGKMWLRTTPDRGKKILQELVAKYPETAQADEARELLEEME